MILFCDSMKFLLGKWLTLTCRCVTDEFLYSMIMESSCAISLEYVKSTINLIRICLCCMWPNYCISDCISIQVDVKMWGSGGLEFRRTCLTILGEGKKMFYSLSWAQNHFHLYPDPHIASPLQSREASLCFLPFGSGSQNLAFIYFCINLCHVNEWYWSVVCLLWRNTSCF